MKGFLAILFTLGALFLATQPATAYQSIFISGGYIGGAPAANAYQAQIGFMSPREAATRSHIGFMTPRAAASRCHIGFGCPPAAVRTGAVGFGRRTGYYR